MAQPTSKPAGSCCDCGAPKPSARHRYCEACRKRRRNAPGGLHPPGSSALRGYGRQHRRQRAAALAAFTVGDPCARCGQPMLDPPELLDLDHTDDRTGYLGLSHASCNRRHTRTAIGKHPRTCEGCGVPYIATARAQRYCSQACYQANRPRREPKPRAPQARSWWNVYFLPCAWCSELFTARRVNVRHCSKRCEDAAYRSKMTSACQVCGVELSGSKAKFCSDQCRYPSHCGRGHEFTPENTRRRPGKGRQCRACRSIERREQKRAAREAPRGTPTTVAA